MGISPDRLPSSPPPVETTTVVYTCVAGFREELDLVTEDFAPEKYELHIQYTHTLWHGTNRIPLTCNGEITAQRG